MGAQMVKEVASKPAMSLATAPPPPPFAQAICCEGESVAAGSNPMDVKRGIDKAVETVSAEQMSKPTKDQKEIAQVGTILPITMKQSKHHCRSDG